jgi:DeoR/GlpR family transcriptional regulator of sugar metabolism
MLAILAKEGYVPVNTFVETFGVSEHTIRRDLDWLDKAGLISRVRGGAVPIKDSDSIEDPYADAKRRIGMAAAALVGAGEILCIDAGSTTLEVAKNLPTSGLSVVTNSVNIAYEIANLRTDIDVTLTGGNVMGGQGGDRFGLSGPLTLQSLDQIGHVSKTIIGALGFDFTYGITDRWYYLAEVKRKMISIAETVILVMDSSKFGKRYLELISKVDTIDILVTDDQILPADMEQLEQLKIRVIAC